MFSKFIEKIKKEYFLLFARENREKGLGVIGTILVTLGVLGAVGGGLFGVYKLGYLGDLGKWTTKEVMGILYSLVILLFGLSRDLFEAVGNSTTLAQSITRDTTVLAGWAIVRDFANMFIVLGFVVVGIAMILRIREYASMKTLVSLIIVAILINFSLLFCGLIIDATNITMNYFFQVSGPPGITAPFASALLDPGLKQQINTIYTSGNFEAFVSASAALSLFTAIAAMLFVIYAILLLFRHVGLMCLVILSPLAFVCYVFPATKSVFKKWWEQFLQWAFIGIPTAFFIYLGGQLLQTMQTGTGAISSTSSPDIAFWVPVAFLLFAYSLIFQTSALGAAGAIGLATGAVGFAAGAVVGVSKLAGKTALKGADAASGGRLSGAGQKISEGYGRALEGMGWRKSGATAQQARGKLDEAGKRIGSLSEGQQTRIAMGRGWQTSQQDRVAAIENKIRSGKISDLGDLQQQKQAIAMAEAHLKDRGLDPTSLRKNALRANPNLGDTPIEIRDAVRSVPAPKAAEWHPDVMTPEVVASLQVNQAKKVGSDGSPELVDRLASFKHDPTRDFEGQSDDYKKAIRHISETTREGTERTRAEAQFAALQNHLATDANFGGTPNTGRGGGSEGGGSTSDRGGGGNLPSSGGGSGHEPGPRGKNIEPEPLSEGYGVNAPHVLPTNETFPIDEPKT